ncbi:MAG: aminoacyl-tRNA hydrolase [Rubricoccaceae bacterium]
MAGPSRLIVGLGNPGAEYEDTRHNVGFLLVDRLAEATGALVRTPAAASLVGEGRWRGRPLALAKPQTFMNLSGQAYQALRRRYGLAPADILVAYDDLALPLGQIRLRGKGGAGGHNGVQDIIDHLGSADFPRLRIGIGDNFARGRQVDYVLAPFADDEREALAAALAAAAEAALTFVRDGLPAAMNRYNRRGA